MIRRSRYWSTNSLMNQNERPPPYGRVTRTHALRGYISSDAPRPLTMQNIGKDWLLRTRVEVSLGNPTK
jgi:hypothetical protein